MLLSPLPLVDEVRDEHCHDGENREQRPQTESQLWLQREIRHHIRPVKFDSNLPSNGLHSYDVATISNVISPLAARSINDGLVFRDVSVAVAVCPVKL